MDNLEAITVLRQLLKPNVQLTIEKLKKAVALAIEALRKEP